LHQPGEKPRPVVLRPPWETRWRKRADGLVRRVTGREGNGGSGERSSLRTYGVRGRGQAAAGGIGVASGGGLSRVRAARSGGNAIIGCGSGWQKIRRLLLLRAGADGGVGWSHPADPSRVPRAGGSAELQHGRRALGRQGSTWARTSDAPCAWRFLPLLLVMAPQPPPPLLLLNYHAAPSPMAGCVTLPFCGGPRPCFCRAFPSSGLSAV